jgi:hypothetical protein
LFPAFIESEAKAALTGGEPGGQELQGRERLPGTAGAGQQDNRVLEEPAAAHPVQFGVA